MLLCIISSNYDALCIASAQSITPPNALIPRCMQGGLMEGERMKSEENPNNASMYMHNECEANEAQLQKCGRMWQSENAQRLPMQMRNSSSQSHVIFESSNDVLLIRYPRVYFPMCACLSTVYSLAFSTPSALDLRRSTPSLVLVLVRLISIGLSSSSDSSTVNRSGLGSLHECRWPERVREYRRWG